MPDASQQALRMFTLALVEGDAERATDIAEVMRGRGAPIGVLVRRLFGPALKRVGQMWQDGLITVAQEHVATTITEECLNAAASAIASPVRRGRVLLTVAEHEWHTLPVRMVSLVWRELGWDVLTVTPSLPAEDLAVMAHEDPSAIGAVSCAMTANLVGAWHAVSALRLAGLRVMTGGGGMDSRPDLGLVIGADAHADDPVAASEILVGWAGEEPLASRGPALEQMLPEIDRVWSSLPRAVEDALVLAPELGPIDVEQDLLRDDLHLIGRTATAAALVGDSRLLAAHLDWFSNRRAAGGGDEALTDILVAALGRVLPAGSATVRSVMAAAVAG